MSHKVTATPEERKAHRKHVDRSLEAAFGMQMKPKRVRTINVVTFEYQGRTQSIAQWAAETGLKAQTIRARVLRYGWTIEKALTTVSGKAKWVPKNDP